MLYNAATSIEKLFLNFFLVLQSRKRLKNNEVIEMENKMLVVTTENIPGRKYEAIGEVFGVTTQSKNFASDFGAGLKSMIGGEIKAYTKMLTTSREVALERLREEAGKLGADAVVMMRFDSGSIAGDMQSVVAYGTAVKFVD